MAKPDRDELLEHRAFLVELEGEYRQYVDAQEAAASGYSDPPVWLPQRRADLIRKAARGQRAMDASGMVFAITPPPAFGGAVLHDLSQQLFAHETPLYSGGSDPSMTARMVLDRMGAAIGALEDQIDQAERPRPERSMRPARRAASRHLPTLWGRLSRVPSFVGFLADLITVGALAVAALKLIGVL